MKKTLPALLLPLLVGCSGDEVQASEDDTQTSEPSILSETIDDLGSIAADKATEIAEKLRERIRNVDRDMDELEEQLRNADAATREKLGRSIEGLARKRDAIATKLTELSSKGGAKLVEAQKEIDRAYEELTLEVGRVLEQYR